MTHPARLMPFDELEAGLWAGVNAKRITVTHDSAAGLSLFCYSKECVYEKAWDDFSLMARGLILDIRKRRVAATPFPKFFNVSERPESIPDLPFEVFEKMDGSLIILFFHNGKWRAATKGSFQSDQAKWAQAWIDGFDTFSLNRGTTYLCEAIYPENKIVIPYSNSGLYLLAAYDFQGEEYARDDLEITAEMIGWPLAKRCDFQSVSELLAKAKALPASEEGYVLRFFNGLRLKIKGDEYLRLHRAISRLTPLAVWEMMAAGDDLLAFRRDLPEEFWPDFDNMFLLIDRQAHRIVKDTHDALAAARNGQDLTDKDIGLMLDKFPAHVRPFVFPYRKQGGNLMQGRSRAALFRHIRPTGNRLAGYVPSSSVSRVMEEAQ